MRALRVAIGIAAVIFVAAAGFLLFAWRSELPEDTAAAEARFAPELVAKGAQLAALGNCIACHTEQVHWRERRSAQDWDTLREQVRRWQDTARLGWRDEDVEAVARHLNDTIYHFPAPGVLAAPGMSPGDLRRPAGSR